MNRTSDFREKEVINIKDGRRLGFVSDVEINLQSGRIEAIVIPSGEDSLGSLAETMNVLYLGKK